LLIGMMGAGKTTVGRLVADHRGWPYFDSDIEVMAATGKNVAEIFATEGEPAFRSAEADALSRALERCPVVISVAGGAVLDPVNRQLIETSGTVVWLRAEVSTLAGRVLSGTHRPLLGDDPLRALTALYEVRRPVYEALADAVVDVDHLSPEEVAAACLRALDRR
jgi:shikimate kinase